VLTPPEQASAEDDGLLTASEVAELKLDADWVILSACNTAAADGTPGADGLSGLAKAFIYAGGRALLVSHWSVFSDAARALTTGTFRALQADPSLRRSGALRAAMLDMLDNAEAPHWAHPIFWSPFVVVGES
jgi:CHAT domain-containing protein